MSNRHPAFLALAIALTVLLVACGKKDDTITQAAKKDVAAGVPAPGIAETKAIMEEAYIYGFPMVAAYKAMVEFNVDKSSSQYKTPFNQIWNDSADLHAEGHRDPDAELGHAVLDGAGRPARRADRAVRAQD